MGWRRRAGGGKRDAAEPAIIEALEGVYAQVWQLGGTGNPDLLVRYQGVYYPMEVKTGSEPRTANQTDIPWPIVRTVEDALRVIGVTR